MSCRGSLVTEYMYCAQCAKAAWAALRNEMGSAQLLDGAIVAAQLRDLDDVSAPMRVIERLERAAPCHDVRVALIAEGEREAIIAVGPSGSRCLVSRGRWYMALDEPLNKAADDAERWER